MSELASIDTELLGQFRDAFGIAARFQLFGAHDLRQFAAFAMKQEEIEIELQRRKRADPEQSMALKVRQEY